jgi:hypothetical protein
MNLGEIEKLTKEFSDSRGTLTGRVSELNEAIDLLKRRFLPLIRHAAQAALEKKSRLEAAIQARPELFHSPRTIVLFGIKIGMAKSRGGVEWEDDDQVVRLIKKHFPELAETLIKTKETPVKQALAQLAIADLKKIAVSASEGGDVVVIKPADGDVDKLVAKLLEEEKQAA